MKPLKIFSFLVAPGKNDPEPEAVVGTEIPLSGRLHKMLSGVFVKSDKECKVPIRFVMADDGSQHNEVRSQITELLKVPTLRKGLVLAERLRAVTTRKSGLGLLFLIVGHEGRDYRVVLSRFPADQGILAETKKGALEVEFVERVFMKNAATYKAALYTGRSLEADFWAGHAVDTQINAPQDQLAHYWIGDFLASDFKTTSKAGSKRLAIALKEASKSAMSIEAKEQILAAIVLVQGFSGKAVSIHDLTDRLNLSDEARSAVTRQVRNETLLDDTFILDLEEFKQYATYATVDLDNGAILTAPAENFRDCFVREVVNQKNNEYRFSTTGRIVDERIKGRA